MLADDISDQIALAANSAELDDVIKDMWTDLTHGRLSENEAEVLDEVARARREAMGARILPAGGKKSRPPKGPPRASMRRPPREKLFGNGRPVPLDREAKNRIWVLIRALTHPTEPGKHYGKVTAKAAEVARVLLWVFHNVKTGLCIPSYETIAEKADCNRDTVAQAIKMLEDAGILTWCNRRARVTIKGTRKIIRISNSYRFIDPKSPKSEIPSGTKNQDRLSLENAAETARTAAKMLGEEARRRGPGIPDGVYPCDEVGLHV